MMGRGLIHSFYYTALFILFCLPLTTLLASEEPTIVVYGEYPVVTELGKGRFEEKAAPENEGLFPYVEGAGYSENARVAALHLLSANVYGYTFFYRPGSTLMKIEETFDLMLRGTVNESIVLPLGDGVYDNMYRVKLGVRVTPSIDKWLRAFRSNNLRLTDAEGTSDFYAGFEGRGDAYREALRNLVLVAAKKKLSSKPLSLKGDILIVGNPEFAVGAGRHYCRVKGYVNFIEVVTY
jgi:hypothetical protein